MMLPYTKRSQKNAGFSFLLRKAINRPKNQKKVLRQTRKKNILTLDFLFLSKTNTPNEMKKMQLINWGIA